MGRKKPDAKELNRLQRLPAGSGTGSRTLCHPPPHAGVWPRLRGQCPCRLGPPSPCWPPPPACPGRAGALALRLRRSLPGRDSLVIHVSGHGRLFEEAFPSTRATLPGTADLAAPDRVGADIPRLLSVPPREHRPLQRRISPVSVTGGPPRGPAMCSVTQETNERG